MRAADKDVWQARIRKAAARTTGRGTGRTQANRARLKRLVPREKSFPEPVPSITQFIDFVRSDRVHVGKGYQLHARRGIGVEPGQLPAGGCQPQGERLHAVSEEITARQNVVG